MVIKKTEDELRGLSLGELSRYIDDITQTPICRDKKHCSLLVKIFLDK